ncbi:unnamed protein product [Danaus chrysippus]|uniref:(African queen) hypothetical protein n=1 Tax=Danaus chrysippus TaxID=151541 RepID=A0A8J2W0Y5_9NEOP|nr:unnamed protein product [Danaus chrysippus]
MNVWSSCTGCERRVVCAIAGVFACVCGRSCGADGGGVCVRRRHRPQDGERAAAGARAARRGEDRRPPEAALGPAIHAAAPRCARRRSQARRHP